jgi:hypothetical protein
MSLLFFRVYSQQRIRLFTLDSYSNSISAHIGLQVNNVTCLSVRGCVFMVISYQV